MLILRTIRQSRTDPYVGRFLPTHLSIARFDSGQLISRVQSRLLQPVLAQLQEVLAQFIESGLSWEERQEHNGHLVRAARWPYPATSAPGTRAHPSHICTGTGRTSSVVPPSVPRSAIVC